MKKVITLSRCIVLITTLIFEEFPSDTAVRDIPTGNFYTTIYELSNYFGGRERKIVYTNQLLRQFMLSNGTTDTWIVH